MLKILIRTLFILTLARPSGALADLVLIANAQIDADNISQEEAINIYMGRLRQFPSGVAAKPLDLPPSGTEKANFYHFLINKNLSDIEAYWARLVFSGRTSPPRTVGSSKEMLELVAGDRSAIGYMDRTQMDKRVKVILELQPKGRL